ncbi:elongation factor 1-delta-like isoform X1 [Mytilus californianus]|uniref:elongation factor 1-delta-like isoform X1 n=1 Tax=Mytilus californianus TaxID=6549 RepID=UPI0022460150|nr:elongation factor 1-delta-like isoform X1 [Mytilus californianus]
MAQPLLLDSTWRDQQKFESAEAVYQCKMAGTSVNNKENSGSSKLINEIAEARQQIQKALSSGGGSALSSGGDGQFSNRMNTLETENKELKKIVDDMKKMVSKLESRVTALEKGGNSSATGSKPAPAPADDDDEDDFDLFGDDDEEAQAEAEKIKQERIKAYAEKKSKKPVLIAKSSIVLDVKPWDDETDMKELEKCVRTVVMDGLVWGNSKLVPVGYGIKKLQIMCVVEDDKVGTDDLEEAITHFEDYVQSVDVSSFNKI